MSPQHRHQPPSDPAQRARAIWTVLGRTGRVAFGLGCVAAVVVLFGFGRFVVVALTAGSAAQSVRGEDEKETAAKQAAAIDAHLAQFNGRSMFFVPLEPRREAPRVADDSTNRPPPPPSRYGGPSLIGFANGAAYFNDGRTLRVGDDSDTTLRVVRMDPPWNATVLWENVEFTVGLFDKDKIVIANHKPGDKPIEGDPVSGSEIDPDLVGPPKPVENQVASGSPTVTPARETKPPAEVPPQEPQNPPAPDTDAPTDPNGATS